MDKVIKRVSRSVGAVAALSALLAVSAAVAAPAGKLPKEGAWFYDSTGSMSQRDALFLAYVNVSAVPGKSFIYHLAVTVIGPCKGKDGRIGRDNFVGGATDTGRSIKIPIKPDGRFSATFKLIGDTGGPGTGTVKGVFNGIRVSGTVTAHMHDPNYGDCKGTGRFVRAKGTPIFG